MLASIPDPAISELSHRRISELPNTNSSKIPNGRERHELDNHVIRRILKIDRKSETPLREKVGGEEGYDDMQYSSER